MEDDDEIVTEEGIETDTEAVEIVESDEASETDEE